MKHGSRGDWWAATVAAGVLIAACAVVFARHADRSVWYDEAWVIEFATADTLGQTLERTLERRQPAAAGYMVLVHGMHRLGGDVIAFRAISGVFGIGMLLVVGFLVGRIAHSRTLGMAAAIGLLLCAFMQRYLGEIKQYMPAAALTMGLVAATGWWLRTQRWQPAVTWLALATMALVLTFAAWFAVAGTGLVLAVGMVTQRRWRDLAVTLAMGVVIAALAGGLHLSFNRHLSGDSNLQEFWAKQFLPRDATLPVAAWAMGVDLLGQAWYTMPSLKHVLLPLALAGWGVWLWRDRWTAVAAGAVVAVTLAANLAGIWPLGHRINLPIIFLGCAAMPALPLGLLGVWLERAKLGRSLRVRGIVPLAGLVAAVGIAAGVLIHTADDDHEVVAIRAMIAELHARSTDADLLVLDGAVSMNVRLFGPVPRGELLHDRWPLPQLLDERFLAAVDARPPGEIYFACGNANPAMREQWEQIGKALASRGRWESVWSDRLVVIYRLARSRPAD
jgi:hypothetical protein